MSGAGTVAEASPYTLSLNHIAQTADPVLGWTILWGDGITQQIAAEADGSTAITHVFADNGPATITAALRTTVGTYPVATSIPVTITAVAPIITVTPSATTIDEGSGLTIDIDAFNQGTGVITKYEVKWGDGSSNTFTDGSTSFSHVYANNGNFNVTVTATDNANKTSNIATNAVTVDDVLPTIVFLSNPVVYEDASYELRFRVVDPGVLDPAITQVRINYGDGTGGQNYNLTPANYTLNPATGFFEAKFIRSFANPGSFTVSVRTSQPVQGQFFSQTATVLSAPPVLAATAKVSGVAGNEWNVGTTANFELGLSYAAGTPSLSKWVINWGDGTAVQTVTTTSTSISVPHTYASTLALGDRYIVATATDATGDYSVGQLVRVINNATPTTGAIGGPVQLITGETGTFTLTNVVDSPADLATMKYSFALSAAGLAANYAAAQSTNSFTHQPGAAGPVTVYARAYDSSGSISTTKTIAVNVFTPPTVGSITINAGNSQRSRVTQIVVNLAEPITLNPTTFSGLGAVTLVRTSGGLPATVQTGATGPSGRITVAPLSGTTSTLSLTFDNADGSGITTGVESGSLADGRWQLNIPLLGYTSPLNAIHRLFGDADANSTVDGSDFATFGNAFGGSSVAFDFDNNGTIDGSDLIQFGNRFGLTL
jgi:PKD repeat protein